MRCLTSTPVVFLHGLLGSVQDWHSVITILQNLGFSHPLALDLPGHGHNDSLAYSDFESIRQQLHALLQQKIAHQPFWLVGYSLGGRLALDYAFNQANPNLLGTIVEGANIGLIDEQARALRWQQDLSWAARFEHEPIEQVLADWYQQPVFASLTLSQRQQLIVERRCNNGQQIAAMLKAASLAKQTNYQSSDWQCIHFIIGEKDQKFRQMAQDNQLPHHLVKDAGHNTHWENPHGFCQQLIHIIRNEYGTTKMS